MLFTIDRDRLFEAVSRTVPIAEKRTSLPILSHILMDALESKVTLIATDLEVGLKISNDCEVQDPGALAIPSRKIYEIVRELPASPLTIKSTGINRIVVEARHGVFELAGMDAADYPAWVTLEEAEEVNVKAEKVVHMIDKTLFASSSDDSRFNLNGVLFEQDGDNLKLVATDGHRLALISEPIGVKIRSNVVIPKKGLGELKRLLEGMKEEISLGFEQKNLVVRTEKIMMTVRLIEGEYPDYMKVIPQSGESTILADREELIRTSRRVATLTSERNKGLNVTIESGQMEITTVHPDLGTARDVVEVEYEGSQLYFMVNAAYLLDALGVIDSEKVCLEYYNEKAPIIVRPDPKGSYFNLIMPMRK